MANSNAERQKQWRRSMLDAGNKRMTLFIGDDARDRLKKIADYYAVTINEAVSIAIMSHALDAPAPIESAPIAIDDAPIEPAPIAIDATVKIKRVRYSDEICLMIFRMKEGGASDDAIAGAVKTALGKDLPASFNTNVGKLVKRGKELATAGAAGNDLQL